MASYMIQQCVQIVELFYENQHSVKIDFRRLREFYGLHNGSTIKLFKNFKRPARWKIKN